MANSNVMTEDFYAENTAIKTQELREEMERANKDEQTTARVENTNQGINKLQKGQEVNINEIRTLAKNDQNEKPIRFDDERNPVKSFTALSLVGKESLDTLAQNLNEELLSQIEQPKYNKRPGTSGISGQLYEIELSMLFLLHGVTRTEDKKINSFYLATQMEEAGDFDDVIFKYKYNENGVEKSKIMFLLAKHKEIEKNENEIMGKEKKVTIDTMLSTSEKGDFILRKYLSSYMKIKQLRLKSDHLIFKDDIESCDFVIYTNALFNFDKSIDSTEEEYVEKEYAEPGDILNLIDCPETVNWYYKIIAGEKIMNALRHSLDFELLIKELAQSLSSGSIDGNKPIFKDYQVSITENVIEKINQREGRLMVEFLEGEFCTALIEEITKKQKKFAEKTVNDLREELKNKKIQLPNKFGSAEVTDLKLPLPRKLISDEEIKEFLSELKLFVNQPNEKRLGEMIKDQIKNMYKVNEQEMDSVFSDVEYRVRKWWKESNEYLTERNTFFQESARVSIKFDVKRPVILFTGRIRELEELHKILQNGGEAVISQMASVTGLGGIGKSELARKYISSHNKDYDDNVIWINADNYLTTTESFRRLAKDKLRISAADENDKEKEITRIVKEVYSFFAKKQRKSIFVFDNAGKYKTVKEGDEGIDRFLPSGPNKPYVLITSRDQDWGQSIAQLQLDVLTEEEAVELIKKSLGIKDVSHESEIRSLAKELQYLPLALQQAVAYINKENRELSKRRKDMFTVSNYLEIYKEKAEELLNKTPGESYDRNTKTVITTWEITIDQIRQRKFRGGIQALQILDIIAYLAPDKIPIEGIFLNLINSKEVLHSAVELLDQYSMANLDEGILNIHRLVQHVTRIKLVGQNREGDVLRKALTVLKKPVKERENHTGSMYTTHAVSAWDYASKHDELVKEFSGLPSLIIKKMDDSVRYEEASLFGKRVSELLKRILGPGHQDTLTAMSSMAEVLYKHGKYVEALEISYEVHEKRKEILGQNHPDTLTIEGDIASVLSIQGKYNEALHVFKELLEKHSLGLGHPDILNIKHHIAKIFTEQGKDEEALQVYNEIYEIAQGNSTIGPYHPSSTVRIRGSIAETLSKLGKYDEALQIFNEVYEKIKDMYGPHHPTALSNRNNRAVVFFKQANYAEALQAFSEVYEIQKREDILGSEHPNTLGTLSNIATVLNRQGNYDKALEMYNEIYKKQVKQLGADHPTTLTITNNIAHVLYSMGIYEEAFQMYKEVFEKSKEVLGFDHPFTAISLNGMAVTHSKHGNYDEVLKIYEKVYELHKEKLGPYHPDTLIIWSNMAAELYEQGKYNEALDIFNEVYWKRKDIFGPNHPHTLNAREYVINCAFHMFAAEASDNLNILDMDGRMPLLYAAKSGDLDVVQLLIEKGANVNLKDKYGRTSLHLATLGGHQEIVQILLRHHANFSIEDENKNTPLDLAQENLIQDPENENFKTITGFLLSVTDDSKSKCQEEQVNGSMSLQECLPGPSSGN